MDWGHSFSLRSSLGLHDDVKENKNRTYYSKYMYMCHIIVSNVCVCVCMHMCVCMYGVLAQDRHKTGNTNRTETTDTGRGDKGYETAQL